MMKLLSVPLLLFVFILTYSTPAKAVGSVSAASCTVGSTFCNPADGVMYKAVNTDCLYTPISKGCTSQATSAPTVAPTAAPTRVPTPAPTSVPTVAPTAVATTVATPAVYTVSYKIDEDKANLDSDPAIPYTSDIMNVPYTFKDKTAGTHFVWVRLIYSDGTSEDRSLGILVNPPVTSTPAPSTTSSRPDLCQSTTISGGVLSQGQSLTITSTAKSAVGQFWFAFYNKDNLYADSGTPKIIMFNGSEYVVKVTPSSATNTYTQTINYSDLNKADGNFNSKIPKNIQVNGYFVGDNGKTSIPQPACVVIFTLQPSISPTSIPTTSSPTPASLNLSGVPTGALDQTGCTTGFTGWACDLLNPNSSLRIDFYADGPAGSGKGIGSAYGTLAAGVGGDAKAIAALCGGTSNHRFYFAPPTKTGNGTSLVDGKAHTIYAYAIGVEGSNHNTLLQQKTYQCSK